MENRQQILSAILETKIVAIIRLQQPGNVLKIAQALHAGGIQAIEVTVGTPNALEAIGDMAAQGGLLAGAGSVIDAETAEKAIARGAEFLVTPVSKPEVIDTAHRHGKPIFSGAFTPNEMVQAYEWGADIVKLFPASILGEKYFSAIQAPLPQIPMMPTGGISFESAARWLRKGAKCLGVGSVLVNESSVRAEDYNQITQNAVRLIKTVEGM